MSPDQGPSLYSVKLTLPADLDDDRIGSIASRLGDQALAVSMARRDHRHDGAWTIAWIFDHEPDAAAMAALLDVPASALELEAVPQVNWLEHSYRQFPPFTVGSFFIHGSHFDGVTPAGSLPLQIDAATAFGSGEHGTTKGCLQALLFLNAQGVSPRAILDMGTGSGILLIAARRLWNCPALGIDIDPEAVRVAAHHGRINNAGEDILWAAGDGFAAPEVAAHGPFDLTIANILAGPLIAMAADLCAATAPGGYVLLSGLLEAQAQDVTAAYEAENLRLIRRIDNDGWVALLLQK